jgi:hypothetical protein
MTYITYTYNQKSKTMKHLLLFLSIFLFTAFFIQLAAQENCRVLIPAIDSIYIGKCKKGFAHGKGTATGVDSYTGRFSEGLPNGKGTYTWANGDIYTGSWMAGKFNGEGILILKLENGDSIVDGLWENNKYLGPKPITPRIITKVSIDRFSIKPTGGIKDRVLIDFFQNGARNTTITNLLMSASNGIETRLGYTVGYDYIEFPVTIKVNYMTMNKLKSEQYQAIFEFEIFEPGDWLVEIHN